MPCLRSTEKRSKGAEEGMKRSDAVLHDPFGLAVHDVQRLVEAGEHLLVELLVLLLGYFGRRAAPEGLAYG